MFPRPSPLQSMEKHHENQQSFRFSRLSTSLQRLIRLDRVNRRDRFSLKKPLRLSARGASFHTKHASNVNAIETYKTLQTRTWPTVSIIDFKCKNTRPKHIRVCARQPRPSYRYVRSRDGAIGGLSHSHTQGRWYLQVIATAGCLA
jgi:hypothetical protein